MDAENLRKMHRVLENEHQEAELLINRTPTSEERNQLSEVNIYLMLALQALQKAINYRLDRK